MKLWPHLLSSLILAAALYPAFGWKAILVLAGGFLIDIDHYIWYVCKYKKLSFFDAYNHFSGQFKEKDFSKNIGILLVFHTLEFMAVMIALSYYTAYSYFFIIGLLLHYLLDLVFLFSVPKSFIANHSVIWWVVKNKILAKSGNKLAKPMN